MRFDIYGDLPQSEENMYWEFQATKIEITKSTQYKNLKLRKHPFPLTCLMTALQIKININIPIYKLVQPVVAIGRDGAEAAEDVSLTRWMPYKHAAEKFLTE